MALRFPVRVLLLTFIAAFVPTAFILLPANLVAESSNPVPFLDQPLVPASAAPGSPALTLTVNGAGFVSTSVVNWNEIRLATIFVGANQLIATVPAQKLATSRTAKITVTSPRPGGGSSNVVLFTVTTPTSSLAFRVLTLNDVTSPIALISADFNNDRRADLAVISQSPEPSCNYQYSGVGSIAILLGNGDGTFTKTATLCLPDFLGTTPLPFALAVDYNADGNADIIAECVSGPYEHVFVYYGNGDGSFTGPNDFFVFAQVSRGGGYRSQTPASATPPNFIWGLTVGDFDGHGQVGSVTAYTDTNGTDAIVLLPDYNFLEFQPGGHGVGNLGAGDFNGDGVLDVATFWSPGLLTFLNNGGGNFTPVPGPDFDDLHSPMAIADFNGDGILDIALRHSNSFAVLLGNGDGTFTPKTGQPISTQSNIFLTTADFNGDGIPDLAAVDAANTVSIYLGNGDGTFQPGLDTTGRGDAPLAFADFNGDGRLDLAVTNSVDGTVSVILQSPIGNVDLSDLSFPSQRVGTTSPPLPVVLTNMGSAPMKLSKIKVSHNFHLGSNQCKRLIQPGESLSIFVTFTPKATGPLSGTLTLSDNATNTPQVVNLSGVGTR